MRFTTFWILILTSLFVEPQSQVVKMQVGDKWTYHFEPAATSLPGPVYSRRILLQKIDSSQGASRRLLTFALRDSGRLTNVIPYKSDSVHDTTILCSFNPLNCAAPTHGARSANYPPTTFADLFKREEVPFSQWSVPVNDTVLFVQRGWLNIFSSSGTACPEPGLYCYYQEQYFQDSLGTLSMRHGYVSSSQPASETWTLLERNGAPIHFDLSRAVGVQGGLRRQGADKAPRIRDRDVRGRYLKDESLRQKGIPRLFAK